MKNESIGDDAFLLQLQRARLRSITLQIQRRPEKTLWVTLILLILLFGAAEWIARQESFQKILTPPKMGSRHYQLGHKLSLLDIATQKGGPIDCIMVGSSMVDTGFDPNVFQEAYKEIAGKEIHCFNFGIDASTATSTAALVRILIEDYQPRILIFGTDPRDYAVPGTHNDPALILQTPWVNFRQGNFSINGWLLDHSYLYRYRPHLGRLVRLNFEGTLQSATKNHFEILSNGFSPFSKVGTYINQPPTPGDDSFEVTYYTRIYSSYMMLNENLEALESIMDYNGKDTKVIVVEMPVSDGIYYFFGNGRADYNQYVTGVGQLADQFHVPFWQTEPLDSIPNSGWMDYSHLNKKGAKIFSTWLGQKVGGLERQRNTQAPLP